MVLVERRMAVPGEHELVKVRDLSTVEVDQIRDDSRLITKIGAPSTFQRLQALVDLTLGRIDLLQQRDAPNKLEIEACESGVKATVEAKDRLEADLESLSHLADGGDVKAELDAIALDSDWVVLGQLADQKLGLHRNRDGEIGPTSDPFVPLSAVVRKAFLIAQEAYSKVLATLQDQTLEAGKRIRALQVECPEGVPCLFPEEIIDEDGKFTSEDIPVQYVSEALRMTRVAELVVAESASPEDAGDAETGAKPPSTEDDQEGESSEEEGDSDASTIEQIDVSGLIKLAATLNDNLEQAWSGALDRAAVEEGIAVQMAALRAAFIGLVQFEQNSDVRVEEPEPSAEYLERLESEPGGAVKILILAQISAFGWAARMIQPVAEPTRVQVSFDQEAESLKRFWESGAFANLKGQLDLLRHLIDLDPSKPKSANRDLESSRRLRLAQSSWWRGDPEACLFHAASALAVKLNTPVAELEANLADRDVPSDAAIGLRTLAANQRGDSVLAEAAVSAIHLSDAVVSLLNPSSAEPSMTPEELFDLMAKELPFEDLSSD